MAVGSRPIAINVNTGTLAYDRPVGTIDQASVVASRSSVVIVAHRGGGSAQGGGYYQGPFPEETIEAFSASVAAGVTWLNPHICMLADRTLACMHDSTPDRTTDASGSVNTADYSTSAFKKLKVTPSNTTKWPGYGQDWGEQHPPLLSELLDAIGGRAALVMECTARGWQTSGTVATAVCDMFQARGLAETAILQSFTAAELTYPASRGVETMYLPPDLGTAGSDAASIAAAMTTAVAWASDKPRHVGINAFPSGQTQAQVITYIQSLVAAGMTVWAYTVARRYDRDWLIAAGVSGIITDEPVYLRTSQRINNGTVDPLSLGVWPNGVLHADQARGRGDLVNGGMQLSYVGASGAQLCVYGSLCPPPNLAAYTIQADFVWDTLDGDTTRYPQLVFACPDDRKASMIAGTGNGMVDGYQVALRQSGAALVVSKFTQSTQTSGTLLSQTTGLPPAPTAGTTTTFKVQVTATQLIVSLIQGGTTYGPWTITDSSFRGGYFALGKNMGSGTKLVVSLKNVSCR